MSVRKRIWTMSSGEQREAWMVLYRDRDRKRCQETFDRKKDADARQAEIKVDMRKGTHVAPSKSPLVSAAAAAWLRSAEASGLERSTQAQYRQHVELHIVPLIGHLKLVDLTPQEVRKFEDELHQGKRSRQMIRKVMTSLGTILADAQEQGLAARNAVRELRRNRKKGKDHRAEKREKGKLKVGVDIPTIDEVARIISSAQGRWHPLLITAVFTGLRASELRGLRWADVDLKKGELHVHQRADRYNDIGKPKSEAGERVVPFGKVVSNTLREWKLACPKSDLDLVFPNGAGKIESHANIVNRGLIPAQLKAMVVTRTGKAKYTGLHSLRHFYASWLINRLEDGGQGLPSKVVQERLGHASITLTYDRYGHLFARGDDGDQIDAAELRVVS
jgi:integrase